MRKFKCLLLFALFFFNIQQSILAQGPKHKKGEIAKKLLQNDSLNPRPDTAVNINPIYPPDPADNPIDSESIARNNRNLEDFVKEQEQRRAKEKRGAYIRIGIGVVLLAVLIVGLMRRRYVKK